MVKAAHLERMHIILVQKLSIVFWVLLVQEFWTIHN
jgi:hypothetical protein